MNTEELFFVPTDLFECYACHRQTYSMLCGCSNPSPNKVGSVLVGYPKDPESYIAKFEKKNQ